MKKSHLALGIVVATWGLAAVADIKREENEMIHAKGTFEVSILPQEVDNAPAKTAGIGRNAIEKTFKGDIEGVSHAEMLWSGDPSTFGSYVAIEKVDGALAGRKGSFVLMHSGVMNEGKPEHWVVRVVPGSGTDQLQGISGTMEIIIADGKHSYDLAYTLP